MAVLDPLFAVGAAVVVFCLMIGVLYLLDPQISEKVWLGVLFILIGVTVLFVLVGLWDFGLIIVGAIGALIGRVILDHMGIAQ